MGNGWCEICNCPMIASERPIYRTNYLYSSFWGCNMPEDELVGHETYYTCPNQHNHNSLIEQSRAAKQRQEIHELKERIRKLEER